MARSSYRRDETLRSENSPVNPFIAFLKLKQANNNSHNNSHATNIMFVHIPGYSFLHSINEKGVYNKLLDICFSRPWVYIDNQRRLQLATLA